MSTCQEGAAAVDGQGGIGAGGSSPPWHGCGFIGCHHGGDGSSSVCRNDVDVVIAGPDTASGVLSVRGIAPALAQRHNYKEGVRAVILFVLFALFVYICVTNKLWK